MRKEYLILSDYLDEMGHTKLADSVDSFIKNSGDIIKGPWSTEIDSNKETNEPDIVKSTRKITREQLAEAVKKLILVEYFDEWPPFVVETDNYGQIVIYTGVKQTEDPDIFEEFPYEE